MKKKSGARAAKKFAGSPALHYTYLYILKNTFLGRHNFRQRRLINRLPDQRSHEEGRQGGRHHSQGRQDPQG